MITRSRDFKINAAMVKGVISEFTKSVLPKFEKMAKAYAGNGAIMGRARASGLPNNKLVHAYPRYIVTMASGYLVGQPVKYTDEAQAEALKVLEDVHKNSKIDSVDAELAACASMYGKGVCICYADEAGKPKAAALDPREAFVVYDDTVEHRPIFGVHWLEKQDAAGKSAGVSVHVHTDTEDLLFEGKTLATINAVPVATQTHVFGDVPMVEFWNNAQETGDFEPVLSLIEAYDVLESDRVNDKQQFTDAVLLLTGCTLDEEEEEYDEEESEGEEGKKRDTRTPAQKLLEEKTLSLPDENAKAEWLIKKGDEAGAEILRNAIKSEIHKQSMVPDLTDEHFAANASGVAMRYKLLGLEQLTKIKERWFREGLEARMRLFAAFMQVLGAGSLNVDTVRIVFTRSLPVNETEVAAMVAQLSGIAPQKTLLAQIPFVQDVDEAMAELDKEREKEAKRQAEAFGGQYADGNDEQKKQDEA